MELGGSPLDEITSNFISLIEVSRLPFVRLNNTDNNDIYSGGWILHGIIRNSSVCIIILYCL